VPSDKGAVEIDRVGGGEDAPPQPVMEATRPRSAPQHHAVPAARTLHLVLIDFLQTARRNEGQLLTLTGMGASMASLFEVSVT
jgi:hypothetical protein